MGCLCFVCYFNIIVCYLYIVLNIKYIINILGENIFEWWWVVGISILLLKIEYVSIVNNLFFDFLWFSE